MPGAGAWLRAEPNLVPQFPWTNFVSDDTREAAARDAVPGLRGPQARDSSGDAPVSCATAVSAVAGRRPPRLTQPWHTRQACVSRGTRARAHSFLRGAI